MQTPNLGLSKNGFRTLCLTTMWSCKEFYADPKNKEALEKWKAEREEAKKNERA